MLNPDAEKMMTSREKSRPTFASCLPNLVDKFSIMVKLFSANYLQRVFYIIISSFNGWGSLTVISNVCVQGRSQNLKGVPQNSMQVFNIDDVRANDVIKTNITKEKKTRVDMLIINVKLAS